MSKITLEREELQDLYIDGLLDDKSYAALALLVDADEYEKSTNFYVVDFITRWTVEVNLENGKSKNKSVSSKVVRDVIDKLIACDRLEADLDLFIRVL